MALVAAVREGVDPARRRASPRARSRSAPQYGSVTINCYGGKCSGGSKNLVAGTLASDNTVYIRLALDIGPKKVVKAARDLGITSQLQGYPSETLGGLRALLLAAGDGQRVRDDRLRRLAQQAQGDHRGPPSRRQGRRPLQAAAPQGVRLRRDVRGHEDPRAEHLRPRHRRARPHRLPRRPARPARPRTTRTPGSSATPRAWRRPSGSASRRRTSRCRTSSTAARSTAARSRRRSGAAT